MPGRTGARRCATQPINYRCTLSELHPLCTVCTTTAPRVLHFSAVHYTLKPVSLGGSCPSCPIAVRPWQCKAQRCYESQSRQLKNEGEKFFPRFARTDRRYPNCLRRGRTTQKMLPTGLYKQYLYFHFTLTFGKLLTSAKQTLHQHCPCTKMWPCDVLIIPLELLSKGWPFVGDCTCGVHLAIIIYSVGHLQRILEEFCTL